MKISSFFIHRFIPNFIIIFLIFFGSSVYGQQPVVSQQLDPHEEARMQDLRNKWNAAQGSFQVQIVNARTLPQVHISIIEQIEEARKDNEIAYIPYIENVRIMILPRSTLNSSYEKLELFKHIQE